MKLSMRKICKSFDDIPVLRDIDFSINEGEICALLGENGAGKSTLMNILGGIYSDYDGAIFINDNEVKFKSPKSSIKKGIGFIHQELNLADDLTVYENIFLTKLKKKGFILDRKYMRQKTSKILNKIGIELSPDEKVGNLDASYKQIVEIAKALLHNASIIIMDEPTSTLTESEIKMIFNMMRTLKKSGISFIFISHKLDEVMEICDTYTVLRDGIVASSGNISDVNPKMLSQFMVGHTIVEAQKETICTSQEEVLKIENLSNGKNFKNISLTIHKGEILGITGLLGDGRSELFRTVFGDYGRNYSGNIFLNGEKIKITSPTIAKKHGIAYLPRNRKENAIIKDMSILDNATIVHISKFCKLGLINNTYRKATFNRLSEKLKIKMNDNKNLITSLSGGNQQKVVLGKWVIERPKVLILDNPTQGVDIGAKEEIYSIIQELADEGVAIAVLSSEAKEIIRITDRCIVMSHGENVGRLERSEMTEKKIMYLATSGYKENTGGKTNE